MSFATRSALVVASLAAIAQAVPKVGLTNPGSECEGFGDNFGLEISQCSAPSLDADEPCPIEGYGHNVQVRADNSSVVHFYEGFITFRANPDDSNNTGEYPISCVPGSGGVPAFFIQAPDTPGTTAEMSWGIIEYGLNQTLVWEDSNIDSKFNPEAYQHIDADGVLDPNWYLGYNSSTTWAIAFNEPGEVSLDDQPFYSARLLVPEYEGADPEDRLKEGEAATFIKIGSI